MVTSDKAVLDQYARVVEEIRSVLQSGAETDWALLNDAAAEYAAACDAVNERLQRCKELLRQGLRSEAVQEAERDPPLLEACAVLDFPELPQWRQMLVSAQMPLPLPLNVELATELNAAYAELQRLEGLLRRMRLLALCRAPLRVRIDLLAQLWAADPRNPAWFEDLKELEGARQEEIRRELKGALARRDVVLSQSLLKELAEGPWRFPPSAAVVEQAKAAWKRVVVEEARSRLPAIAERLEAAYGALDYAAARGAADDWETTCRWAELPDDAPLRVRVEPALRWLAEQEQSERQQRMLAEAQAALSSALARKASRTELEQLHAWLSQLPVRPHPAMAELLARCERRIDALRREAARKTVLAVVVAVAALCLCITLLVLVVVW
jgi:hypothetical protein